MRRLTACLQLREFELRVKATVALAYIPYECREVGAVLREALAVRGVKIAISLIIEMRVPLFRELELNLRDGRPYFGSRQRMPRGPLRSSHPTDGNPK
jgi:hypothetical protein